MTPIDAIFELWGRVGASRGAAVLVNDKELRQWPDAAVKAMKSQKLIVKARPAKSAECPGCERECTMPVHTLPQTAGAQASFIVCDQRSDINRVTIPTDRLTQWQCSADLVCRFVADSLGIRLRDRQMLESGLWEIGIVSGKKRSQMLCLKADNTLALVVGGRHTPLSDLIDFNDDKYLLDDPMIRQMVDSSTTADSRYTPSSFKREARKQATQATHESWRKTYRNLKKNHPNMSAVWISQKIAKMDIAQGRKAETIRKNMKK
ncbi:MAG: hypothetical protein AB1427_09005 [Thermodesulfobacteriota bacterium]